MGLNVAGREIALTLKAEPCAVTCVTVKLAVPGLLIVTGWLVEVPTVTLPKLMLGGFRAICAVGVATAVAFSVIVRGAPGALLWMVSVPVALPAPEGVNFTMMAPFCPAGMVAGSDGPATLNPEPLTFTWEIVTGTSPLLVTVTLCVLLLPIVTLPKFTLLESAESWPELAPVTPHPLAARTPARASPSKNRPPCARRPRPSGAV